MPHVTLPFALLSNRMSLCNRGANFFMKQLDLFEQEVWKDILDYEKLYQVSTLSRVRSLSRYKKGKIGNLIFIEGQIMLPSLATNGYPQITLSKNGKSKIFRIHRLMAIAFIPNPENKKEVNHINGIKTDNRIENLEWATKSENAFHAFQTGLHIPHNCKGTKNGRAKLSEEDVKEIIALLPFKKNSELGPTYGLTPETISAIRTGRLWKNIPR